MTMRTTRKCLLAVLLCGLFLLNGCVSNLPMEKQDNGLVLPTVRPGLGAPIGDNQTERESIAVLYVPNEEGTKLVSSMQVVTIQSGETKAEAYVRALLSAINASPFHTGGMPFQLAPVSNAVQTTGDLVTINLNQYTRVLGSKEMSALRLAIANTLTELPGIIYVNVLVNGSDTGLDLGGTLPSGVLARYPSGDLTTFWGQREAELNAPAAELQKAAALYFVSDNREALLGEVRSVAFSQRTPEAYAQRLIEELAKGPGQIRNARAIVPDWDYFAKRPSVTSLGGTDQYIQIDLKKDIDGLLSLRGETRAMLLSSICYTLTEFIPGIKGIVTTIDGKLVTELTMMDGTVWKKQNGTMTRDDLASLAADTCTVYFPLADGSGLRAVTRPIAQRFRAQPRALLRELMKPPSSQAFSAALPQGVTDADILGLQIVGDTALVNLSAAFAAGCKGMTLAQERDMIYAMVNTLTEIEGVSRVRFYVNGSVGTLAGNLFAGGEFLRNTGLIR